MLDKCFSWKTVWLGNLHYKWKTTMVAVVNKFYYSNLVHGSSAGKFNFLYVNY